MKVKMRSGCPNHLGARFDGEGTNFAVFSTNAARIDLCLFSDDGRVETDRITLPERTGHIWHGYAPGIAPGTQYGYRADGEYAPERGHRFNNNKLLMDPYTRELRGHWVDDPATLGYDQRSSGHDLSFDSQDSAPFVPRSVVSAAEFIDHVERRPDLDWSQTLIYEAHPKGLTMEHPGVSESLRGTYEGLADDVILTHLQKLGVTAVELLPVHAFADDGFLVKKKLRNYWGYNTLGFFAAESRYFGPGGLAGFRDMVRRFHSAGIKVILDVVYNHTGEGDQRGPTLCYRGLDNASYYRLSADNPRFYINDTGTGNTLNVSHPFVLRMIMDSLRFWVQQMGIDGFRFDLATTLGREAHGFDRSGGFFDAIRQDPVLADVRLIAEPWDIGPGGYRVGDFPPQFSEWNDAFRDGVRRYWRGDRRSTHELASVLLGSAERFDTEGRRAWSSVNYVAAHDGFTLADLTSYSKRRNAANGENGADGHPHNFSDNCGVEGDSKDPVIIARRARRRRNILATLFLAQGTPMLLAGDEFGNSQSGNNNAYCQDNSIGWLNWGEADDALTAFVARLSAFRADHPVLRQSRFLHGTLRRDGLQDVEWRAPDGGSVQWNDDGVPSFCLILREAAATPDYQCTGDTVFIVFNRNYGDVQVRLPDPPAGRVWLRCIDTAASDDVADVLAGETMTVAGHSVVAAAAMPGEVV